MNGVVGGALVDEAEAGRPVRATLGCTSCGAGVDRTLFIISPRREIRHQSPRVLARWGLWCSLAGGGRREANVGTHTSIPLAQ